MLSNVIVFLLKNHSGYSSKERTILSIGCATVQIGFLWIRRSGFPIFVENDPIRLRSCGVFLKQTECEIETVMTPRVGSTIDALDVDVCYRISGGIGDQREHFV